MTRELTPWEALLESTAQLAALVRTYYKALVEEGFSEQDAAALTIDYQRSILAMSKKGGTE